MTRSVTLAIPCHDAARSLTAVLRAVLTLRPAADEVLLVDDGSSDDSAASAARHGVRVVAHRRNLGVAAARNSALRAAACDIVAFVDADAIPAPDLLAHLTRGYDDPLLAAIGGQVIEQRRDTAIDRWRGAFWRQTLGERPLREAPFFIGACCSVRRCALLRAGGFDERHTTNGEDVAAALRLRRLGLRVAYEPRARVEHIRQDDAISLLRMIYRHQRGHVSALRAANESAVRVVRNALRWGPITLVSSLRRHRSPALAALCPLCYAASLAGCAAGMRGDGGEVRRAPTAPGCTTRAS